MRRSRRAAITVLLAAAGPAACECADRRHLDEGEASSSTSLDTAGVTVMTTTDEAGLDVSRFFGIFHAEAWFTPFGYEGYDLGSTLLANVEFLPDGTASMLWDECSPTRGATEIAWRWEARSDDWIELVPGPGEGSLRWLSYTDLASLRATIDERCEVTFEVDGELIDVPFRPGEACWVNRCEGGKAHVDYCEQPPPGCE